MFNTWYSVKNSDGNSAYAIAKTLRNIEMAKEVCLVMKTEHGLFRKKAAAKEARQARKST